MLFTDSFFLLIYKKLDPKQTHQTTEKQPAPMRPHLREDLQDQQDGEQVGDRVDRARVPSLPHNSSQLKYVRKSADKSALLMPLVHRGDLLPESAGPVFRVLRVSALSWEKRNSISNKYN